MEEIYLSEFRTDNLTNDLIKPSTLERKALKVSDSKYFFDKTQEMLDGSFIYLIIWPN